MLVLVQHHFFKRQYRLIWQAAVVIEPDTRLERPLGVTTAPLLVNDLRGLQPLQPLGA